ncbi:MAG: PQQ-dependent sugar dehydrogenase [Chloroflexota bacterium]|nr:PQQ-dependent sugar dehydrogenase [Chloroflexota bacterium]
MNRIRSYNIGAALVALLLLASVAVACGDDEQTQASRGAPSQQVAPDEPQSTARSVEASDQAADQRDDSGASESAQQSRAEVRQDAQQDDEAQTAADQPEQAARDESESEAEPAPVTLGLRPILGGHQFHQPIEMLELPDGSFLVAEQRGYITRFVQDNGEVEQFGILDLTESITFRGEQGLLSMALHPDYEDNPFLFVYYSPRGESMTRLSRFRIVQGQAFVEAELVIIEIPQPYSNHNGGAIRFGPDGMLYLGLGDGGAANDPQGHGQNRETLLGTIIRIEVNDIDTATPYRIPTDNPFLGIAGVRPEIWAFGLRNPWRMAFDQETGLLWAGDVGQDRVEEIVIVRAGENHGWNVFEGDECFRSDDDCAALTDAIAPVGTYGHDEGCSVTGGMVYRGNALRHLQGVYIFSDFCSGTIWGLWPDDSAETGWARETILESGELIASFAVDDDGEVYVLVFGGPILKLVAE